MTRIDELVQLISDYSDKYYNDVPTISDVEFDKLVKELSELDPNNAILLAVGAVPSYGKKVKHSIPMGSLSKVTVQFDPKTGDLIGDGMAELRDWEKNHPSNSKKIWSLKIDGCAAELTYVNQKLKLAVTRGNGIEGSDITDNVMQIKSTTVPKSIDSDAYLNTGISIYSEIKVRGEMYIPRSFFDQHLKNSGSGMANCRNAASGSLQAKNPLDTKSRGLQFFAYNIFIDGNQISSMIEQEKIVNALGFTHVKLHTDYLSASLISDIDNERKTYDFDTDGIVLTIDSLNERQKYGFTGLNPNGSVAFKFRAETSETQIVDVEWSTGRTGKVTPVAILNTVRLAGTDVSRCTLHNVNEIQSLGAGIGSHVILQKSGDIIPKIIRVSKNPASDPVLSCKTPIYCPSCDSKLIKDGSYLICENAFCTAKLATRIEHYLKKLNIKGIGPAIIEGLISHKLVTNISSLYDIDKSQIYMLDGVSDKKVETIYAAIWSKTQIPISDFLSALGIPMLGDTASEIIARQYSTISSLYDNMSINKFIGLTDIGQSRAESIIAGLTQMKSEIDILNHILNIMPYTEIKGRLSGMNFCCTGSLSMPRPEIKKMIVNHGGKYTGINKELNVLIIGDGAKQQKIEKAKSFGTKIVDESMFMNMFK